MESVYGPVSSWRLDRSLGLDLICEMKVCPFDCIYCSLGRTTNKSIDREKFVSTDKLVTELESVLEKVEADFLTFSGTGEPTLAENLGEAIDEIKKISDIPVAVLTSSALMYRKNVRSDLLKADNVVGSLDAHNQKLFEYINKPHQDLKIGEIVKGMKKFSKIYDGKFSLEIMFTPENKKYSEEISNIAEEINPEEIQINTPLRPNNTKTLNREKLEEIKNEFKFTETVSVYGEKRIEVKNKVGRKK